MQQKDKQIQQQQTLIQQQQDFLSGQILIKSMQQQDFTQEDKESLVGDMVLVKKYMLNGAEIYLPEMLRRLKKFFSRKRL